VMTANARSWVTEASDFAGHYDSRTVRASDNECDRETNEPLR